MLIPEGYVSNTLASNNNQTVFEAEGMQTGLVFIKVFKGGSFSYRFAYSGIIDTTYADGSKSVCNYICPEWTIHSLEAAVSCGCNPDITGQLNFREITFSGKKEAKINGDKLVFTDETELDAAKDSYICLRITFSGTVIPCHTESIISAFIMKNGEYTASTQLPLPVFTGIKREAELKIGFIGDSITQGIGTDFNSYRHYAALIAEELTDKYAFWDLGTGYSRGFDAASDGVWLEKAKENDIVSVCFGVNDIFWPRTAEQIEKDLETIITKLRESGTKVILQTIPPFDYDEEHASVWRSVNEYIRNTLVNKADYVFDCVPVLSRDGCSSPASKYGSHPDNEGHRKWAEQLLPVFRKICGEVEK